MQRALTAVDRGDDQNARSNFEAVLEHDPDAAIALLHLGQLALEDANIDTARQYWERIPDQATPEAAEARYLQGVLELQTNLARKAERLFLRALALDAQDPRPREILVRLYFAQLRSAEAVEQLYALRTMRPWSFPELLLSVSIRDKTAAGAEQIQSLEQFIAADPADLQSRLGLARRYLVAERYSDAARLLQYELKGQQDRHASAMLAEINLREDKLQEAHNILAANHHDGEVVPNECRTRGLLAFAEQDWPRAVAQFECVLADDAWDVEINYKYGLALQRVGRIEDALDALANSRRLEDLYREVYVLARNSRQPGPQLAKQLREIGKLLVDLNQPQAAIPWLEQALQFSPRDLLTRQQLQRALKLQTVLARNSSKKATAATGNENRPTSLSAQVDHHLPQAPTPRTDKPDVDDWATIQLDDRHVSAGIDFQYFNGATGGKYLLETTGGGVAVLDYDGDGWPDLYFPQGCRIPVDLQDDTHIDRLFRNRGDGTFSDVTAQAGLGDRGYSQGCSAADFDNDGDPDLVVANWGRNTCYRNNGDGTFTDVTADCSLVGDEWSSSVAFADLDRDGNLDLYVVNYLSDPLKTCRTPDGRIATCHPGNSTGVQDRVYRNTGDGRFEDVTEQAGFLATDGKGLGIMIADLDDDGWMDVYVANDGVPNYLYQNQIEQHAGSMHFAETGIVSGAGVSGEGLAQAGMGIACADFDDDNRPDLYVTNFLGEVNTLYLNEGGLQYRDATRAADLALATSPVLGFGTQAIDFDLDGHPDLVVANGHIDDFRYRGEPWKMRPQLFQNRGNRRFVDVTDECGDYFAGEYLGRGVARLDYNRDGLPDAVVVHQDRPVAILQNKTRVNHRLVLNLRGTQSNRDGIGARLTLHYGDRTQTVQTVGGDGFLASNERKLVIGVGSAVQVDTLEIRWPGGLQETWHDLPVDHEIMLLENRPGHLAMRSFKTVRGQGADVLPQYE